MSKYLSNYDSKYLYDYDSKCGYPNCDPPCDPIDINININCCPDGNGDDDQCCCQQGVFEALNFLRNQDEVVDNISVIGFATGGGNILSSGTITTLTEDYVILDDFPNRVVSLCAIWIIRVPVVQVPDGITSEACEETTTDCCCNPGLRDRLRIIPSTQQVKIKLNNQDQNTNPTTGFIQLVCNDSVWIQQANDYVSIPLCNIAWFEQVV